MMHDDGVDGVERRPTTADSAAEPSARQTVTGQSIGPPSIGAGPLPSFTEFFFFFTTTRRRFRRYGSDARAAGLVESALKDIVEVDCVPASSATPRPCPWQQMQSTVVGKTSSSSSSSSSSFFFFFIFCCFLSSFYFY